MINYSLGLCCLTCVHSKTVAFLNATKLPDLIPFHKNISWFGVKIILTAKLASILNFILMNKTTTAQFLEGNMSSMESMLFFNQHYEARPIA